jgi:hypothetical protein
MYKIGYCFKGRINLLLTMNKTLQNHFKKTVPFFTGNSNIFFDSSINVRQREIIYPKNKIWSFIRKTYNSKVGWITDYLPIQKSLKILFRISSVVTVPTISPSLSSESLSSIAMISMG